MDLKTVKLNCLTLGESKGFPKIYPKKWSIPLNQAWFLHLWKCRKCISAVSHDSN